jgi:hypothetical protein
MDATLRSKPLLVVAFVTVLSFVLAAVGGASAVGNAPSQPAVGSISPAIDDVLAQIEAEDGVLRFDVAEDGSRFVWSGNPLLVDGMPDGSTPYVTQGYIYPEGTLGESNGVLADGSPEFPDKVLGQWSCWGWRLGPSDHATGPMWLTSHLFNFGEGWGEATLMTEGYSIDDLGVALERVIAGGTGPYAGASGVQLETNLGFNESHGGNFRYELRLSDS